MFLNSCMNRKIIWIHEITLGVVYEDKIYIFQNFLEKK